MVFMIGESFRFINTNVSIPSILYNQSNIIPYHHLLQLLMLPVLKDKIFCCLLLLLFCRSISVIENKKKLEMFQETENCFARRAFREKMKI